MYDTVIFENRNRCYVSPTIGCEYSCNYCYLRSLGINTGISQLNVESAESLLDKVLHNKMYKEGTEGTIISLGCFTEPLSKMTTTVTTEVVKTLLRLGNRVSISTKSDPLPLCQSMASMQKEHGQFTVFISIPIYSNWTRFEKNTLSPPERIARIPQILSLGINTVLYIKPILPNFVKLDAKILSDSAKMHSIPVVLGSLFSTNKTSNIAPIPSTGLYTQQTNFHNDIIHYFQDVEVYTRSIELLDNH